MIINENTNGEDNNDDNRISTNFSKFLSTKKNKISPAEKRKFSAIGDNTERKRLIELNKYSAQAAIEIKNKEKKQGNKGPGGTEDEQKKIVQDYLENKAKIEVEEKKKNKKKRIEKVSPKNKKSGSMFGKIAGGIAASLGAMYGIVT